MNRDVAGQRQARFYARAGEQRFWKAANYSWHLHNGVNLGGLHVLHTCDNPLCVNPDHLFLGTHQDNMDDKVEKGRQARGEGHGRAKLTEDDVREIKSSDTPTGELANKFGVHYTTVLKVRLGERWTHVD